MNETPRRDRPDIPPEYGTRRAKKWVEWEHVEERFRSEEVYWVVTVGEEGRPHVRPVDGLYVDGVIYVGGSPKTRWVRNVRRDPRVTVHLDGINDVIVMEGDAEVLTSMEKERAGRVAAASKAKFPGYGMTAAAYESNGAIAITPRVVMAWSRIMDDPTRFTFER